LGGGAMLLQGGAPAEVCAALATARAEAQAIKPQADSRLVCIPCSSPILRQRR
jgi:hypothetical protein